MSNRKRVLLLLLLPLVIAFGVGWRSILPSSNDGVSNMFIDIEGAAKKAKDGDEIAVRELADAVFNYSAPMLPSLASDGMKDRLVKAEMKYRQGHKGVHEEDIAKAVNNLAETFDAPAYARTNPLQVKVLRTRLMGAFPSFIAQERDDKKKGLKKKVGQTMNPEASPLEAAFITIMMVQQKMLNEDFQKTPEEFAATLNMKLEQENRVRAGEKTEAHLVTRKASKKLVEMDGVIGKGVARLGVLGLKNLADKTLDTLGIEQ